MTSQDLSTAWLSFGPDEGVKCQLFTREACGTQGYVDEIVWPGTGDVDVWGRAERVEKGGRAVRVTYTGYSCWAEA
jgi:hypothetical protein